MMMLALLGEEYYENRYYKTKADSQDAHEGIRPTHIEIDPESSIDYATGEWNAYYVYTCPECGEETEVYSRITGYYRPIKNWNDGKRAEYVMRKEYNPKYENNLNVLNSCKLKTDAYGGNLSDTNFFYYKFIQTDKQIVMFIQIPRNR